MSEEHQYTIRTALENGAIDRRVIILSYLDFLSFAQLPISDYIFVDQERLSSDEIAAAGHRLAALRRAVPGIRVLNAPRPALERLTVMRSLHAAGINGFRVVPANDLPPGLRFPVFVRRLDNHDGPMTDLLHDAEALEAALVAICTAENLPRASLAVTEYVDARDALGRHQKFSYFRIGDVLFPSARDLSTNWVCKGFVEDSQTVREPDAEIAFLSGNAHEPLIRPAFEAAGIEYGRADYVVVDDRPQVFEINTNPYLDPPDFLPPEFRSYSERLMARWADALAAFSPPMAPHAPRWIPVEHAILAEPPGGHAVRRRFRRLLVATGQLHRETEVMLVLRAPKRLARRFRNRLRSSSGLDLPTRGT